MKEIIFTLLMALAASNAHAESKAEKCKDAQKDVKKYCPVTITATTSSTTSTRNTTTTLPPIGNASLIDLAVVSIESEELRYLPAYRAVYGVNFTVANLSSSETLGATGTFTLTPVDSSGADIGPQGLGGTAGAWPYAPLSQGYFPLLITSPLPLGFGDGLYRIKVCVINGADVNPLNDCLTKIVSVTSL